MTRDSVIDTLSEVIVAPVTRTLRGIRLPGVRSGLVSTWLPASLRYDPNP